MREDEPGGAQDRRLLLRRCVVLEKIELERYKEKAKAKFTEALNKQADWIANDCYACNLESNLQKLNAIIEAGKQMGVTNALVFEEAEIKFLAEQFSPFRILDMKAEVYGLLIQVLVGEKGVHPEIFAR